MPPYSSLKLAEDGVPSTNDLPSPAGSCISIEDYKFAQAPSEREDDGRCNRRVSFDTQRVTVRFIEPMSEWTGEERQARWHSQEDYSTFRRDVFHTLYQLRNHPESIDGIAYTIRGVECRDPAIVGRRQRVKQAGWQAVFGEQEARRNRGENRPNDGPDWMATLYSNAARPTVLESLDLAALDELEVKEFYKNDQQPNCACGTDDAFSDDWIRSVSSCGENPTLPTKAATATGQQEEEECGFCVFGGSSGFDDSWLRGD